MKCVIVRVRHYRSVARKWFMQGFILFSIHCYCFLRMNYALTIFGSTEDVSRGLHFHNVIIFADLCLSHQIWSVGYGVLFSRE